VVEDVERRETEDDPSLLDNPVEVLDLVRKGELIRILLVSKCSLTNQEDSALESQPMQDQMVFSFSGQAVSNSLSLSSRPMRLRTSNKS